MSTRNIYQRACTMCEQVLPLSAFSRDGNRLCGRMYVCKSCARVGTRRREVVRRLTKRADQLIRSIKSRSKKRGLACDLGQHIADIQARIDAGFCELSGLPFDIILGVSPFAPSIDKIDPNGGYLYSNIRVVCHSVNCALGYWGVETLLSIADAIRSKPKSPERLSPTGPTTNDSMK